jgi:hypothetical protein
MSFEIITLNQHDISLTSKDCEGLEKWYFLFGNGILKFQNPNRKNLECMLENELLELDLDSYLASTDLAIYKLLANDKLQMDYQDIMKKIKNSTTYVPCEEKDIDVLLYLDESIKYIQNVLMRRDKKREKQFYKWSPDYCNLDYQQKNGILFY